MKNETVWLRGLFIKDSIFNLRVIELKSSVFREKKDKFHRFFVHFGMDGRNRESKPIFWCCERITNSKNLMNLKKQDEFKIFIKMPKIVMLLVNSVWNRKRNKNLDLNNLMHKIFLFLNALKKEFQSLEMSQEKKSNLQFLTDIRNNSEKKYKLHRTAELIEENKTRNSHSSRGRTSRSLI